MRPPGALTDAERFAEYVKATSSPCPLLTQEKTCLMHDARPVVCRAYGVMRTTGPECPRPMSKVRVQPYIGGQAEADWLSIMRRLAKGATSGLLPTMILLAADPKRLNKLVHQGVPAGKLLLRDNDLPGVLTQDQWVAEMENRARARRNVALSYESVEATPRELIGQT
jgi:Fe-S-cluster containining protein